MPTSDERRAEQVAAILREGGLSVQHMAKLVARASGYDSVQLDPVDLGAMVAELRQRRTADLTADPVALADARELLAILRTMTCASPVVKGVDYTARLEAEVTRLLAVVDDKERALATIALERPLSITLRSAENRVAELEVALREACDSWEAWLSAEGRGPAPQHERIAACRAVLDGKPAP